ncbi:hypothetical protein [Devosia limi]|uniref:hypothetical protein n=1 Tax=Devosia limi TaxID=288995 RepID=UPI0006174954|nr:hypothetical protein [Devosia limi]
MNVGERMEEEGEEKKGEGMGRAERSRVTGERREWDMGRRGDVVTRKESSARTGLERVITEKYGIRREEKRKKRRRKRHRKK